MGTKFLGTIEEIRALNAWIKMVRAVDTLKTRIEGHLSDYNLTVPQFGVLEILFHLGTQCQKSIGEKLLSSAGNITLVVDNLEKLELVKRVRNIKDRRFYEVQLTQQGNALITKIFYKHAIGVANAFSILTGDEQDELGKLCKKLGTGKS